MEAEEHICPNCMGENLNEKGFYYTQTSKFQAFQCEDCGAVSRLRTAKVRMKPTNLLKRSIAR